MAALAGPIVLAAYVIGALTVTWLHRDGVSQRDDIGRPSDLALEGFVALAASTLAWQIIEQVSPGSGFSRIGYFSNQVLAAWQSVALWAGLGVVAGFAAPVFRRFRGQPAIAGAAALLAVHFPWFLFAALTAGVVGFAAAHSLHAARGAAIVALVPTAWLGWVLEWLPAWGLPAGPEATVWCLSLSLVLGVRWWNDRPSAIHA